MPQSLASRSDSLALAAAMSRHPAAGARGTLPTPGDTASSATVVALLTGPWRANEPVAFDAAVRAAPLVAGRAVGGGLRAPVRLAWGALRACLAGPARAGEGLAPPVSETTADAVVLPFRR